MLILQKEDFMNKKPIVIEFTGTPNSGKTTLIRGLEKELISRNYNVEVKQEDAELVPKNIPKKTWARNSWITFGQLQSLIEVKFSNADIILFDRGYYDALFWTQFLYHQGSCTLDESVTLYKVLKETNAVYNLIPDWLFIIDVSTGVSIERRKKMGGKIVLTNEEFISTYKMELEEFYKGIISNQWRLNTTTLTIEEVRNVALKQILKIIS